MTTLATYQRLDRLNASSEAETVCFSWELFLFFLFLLPFSVFFLLFSLHI